MSTQTKEWARTVRVRKADVWRIADEGIEYHYGYGGEPTFDLYVNLETGEILRALKDEGDGEPATRALAAVVLKSKATLERIAADRERWCQIPDFCGLSGEDYGRDDVEEAMRRDRELATKHVVESLRAKGGVDVEWVLT
jgi:hypothetical protein